MGRGIELARLDAPYHAALMDEFKEQLLIAFLRRLTDEGVKPLVVPVSEVDATGQFLLAFKIVGPAGAQSFHFELRKKQ